MIVKSQDSKDVPGLAIILAGGFGTRLGDVTKDTPKPMLPIGGKPILGYMLDNLIANGMKNIALAIGYKADIIRGYVDANYAGKANILYFEEEEPLGTGGAVKNIVETIKTKYGDVLVIFGDDISDIDVKRMYKFHREKNALVTISVTQVEDVSGYGVVEIQNGVVTNFVEKPDPKKARSRMVFNGTDILSSEALAMLPKTKSFSLSKDFLEHAAKKGIIYAYETNHRWYPIDTPERYKRAKEKMEKVERE